MSNSASVNSPQPDHHQQHKLQQQQQQSSSRSSSRNPSSRAPSVSPPPSTATGHSTRQPSVSSSSSGPHSVHRLLRTKKKSLELPDLASPSLTPASSHVHSPDPAYRRHKPSSPIPIPSAANGHVPTSGGGRQLPSTTDFLVQLLTATGHSTRQPSVSSSSSAPHSVHRSLLTKKKSLELPDLASLSLTPASSHVHSPDPAYRRYTPSSPIPIPSAANGHVPASGGGGQLPSTTDFHAQPFTHIPIYPPSGQSSNSSVWNSDNNTNGHHHHRNAPIPPPVLAKQDEPFVEETVRSTTPLGLGPDVVAVKEAVPTTISWHAKATTVFLARAGDANWKGRQPMDKVRDDLFSTVVRLLPGTHYIKFIVDDVWCVTDHLPTAVDNDGSLANYIDVVPRLQLLPSSNLAPSAVGEDTRGERDTGSEMAYIVESDVMNYTNDDGSFSIAGSTLRRRHVSGYKVDSEDKLDSEDEDEDEDEDFCGITSPAGRQPPATRDGVIIIRPPSHVVYDAPNLLPVASVASARLGRAVSDTSSSLFDDCTYYRDLREALHDAHLDAIKSKLVQEWMFAGSILGGLVALGTTVFGFNSDTIFSVDSLSVRALAASTACAALGLILAIWLLFRCWAADAQAFERFARGVYSTYFFFALTSRLPLLLMLLSLCSLVVFVLDITLRVLPSGIGILCILVAVLCLLQYIVRGAELVVSGLTRALYAVRATGRELTMALRTGPAVGTTTSAPEGPARSPATTVQTGSTTFTPR